MPTTIALVEHSAAFIGTAQLLRVVAHLGMAAFLAGQLNQNSSFQLIIVDGLHLGALGAQRGRESRGLGARDDRLGGRVFAGRAADGACQDDIFLSRAAVEQVAAVVAEDERADGGHCEAGA